MLGLLQSLALQREHHHRERRRHRMRMPVVVKTGNLHHRQHQLGEGSGREQRRSDLDRDAFDQRSVSRVSQFVSLCVFLRL